MLVPALPARYFDIVAPGQHQDLPGDPGAAHGIAGDGGDGAKIKLRMAHGERDRQHIVDIRAGVGVENEGDWLACGDYHWGESGASPISTSSTMTICCPARKFGTSRAAS